MNQKSMTTKDTTEKTVHDKRWSPKTGQDVKVE